jgi:anaerobic magnesium-protoporphyrin IX monomethyl ester cyclase
MSAGRKVVLYNPRAVFFTMPLALVAVGSALDRKRYDVVVVDARLEEDPLGRLVAESEGALLVGVTVLTGTPLKDALEATRALKRVRPEVSVVWGGWHPSLFPLQCLDEPGVDVVVSGQGEDTLRELADRLAAGQSLEGCRGTAYRREGRAVQNPPRPLRDLNELPRHDYTLLPMERYFASKKARQLDYVSSQGCRFRCGFCADPNVYKRGWTGLAPERVAEEVQDLARRYGAEEVAFQDETFFTQAARVEAISDEFLRRGLGVTWSATMRADQAARLGEDLLAKTRRAGLTRVMIGVESGSQRTLDWMKKDMRVELVGETAERLRRHGIGAIFNFIVGFPGESEESVAASLALMKKLRSLSPDFETPVFYYRPYPGTEIAEAAREHGYVFPSTLEDWAAFDYVGSRGPWVSEALFRRVERAKFYARHAFGPRHPLRWPLRVASRWRCERDFYDFPLEKRLVEWLRPPLAAS